MFEKFWDPHIKVIMQLPHNEFSKLQGGKKAEEKHNIA